MADSFGRSTKTLTFLRWATEYRDFSSPRRMRYLEVATSETHGKCVLVLSCFDVVFVVCHANAFVRLVRQEFQATVFKTAVG